MTAKYFKYVLFNTKTGAILNTVEPKEDTTLMDINNTGTIELDIPFHSLTNAQRKDISNVFQPINKGVALLRMNELGETIGCVDAGIIVKREFSVEEQNAHIQTTGFAGYLAKIGAKWVTTPITAKPAPTVTYSGTPAQIYTAILNGALINSDGISTIQNWETGFGSTDTRTGTFTFPLTDFYTAQDAIEEVRDEIFEGKAAEIRWVPVLQIADNKIKWVARTTTDSNSLINVGMSPLELPLKSWEPSVREIASYEINEDAQDIYNYLVIDASEGSGDNETVFIKAKNETETGGLTVFQSFDTGVDLTDAQMDAQLTSRLKNASKPEKSGTITLTGSALALENIPYSYEVNGSNYFVNYNTIGRRIKGVAGSKATGLGSTLRCTELSFSIRQWDTSLTLTLQTIMNVYPSLPSQRKLETKKAKKRTSSKKQKKDRDKIKTKTIKGGNDDTLGSDFEWDGTDSGNPIDDVGGSDSTNKPELKPNKLPTGEPSDYTIGSTWNQWYSKFQERNDMTIKSPVFKWKDGNNYAIGYKYNFTNSRGDDTTQIPLSFQMMQLGEIGNSELIQRTTDSIDTLPHIAKTINMISFNEILNLAPTSRFPETFKIWEQPYFSQDPSDVAERTINSNWKTNVYRFANFYCFVMNNRFYGHLIIEANGGRYRYSRTSLYSEVFFTAELDDDLTTLSNYELLTSPAEQIWGSTGQYKIISMNSLNSNSLSPENFNRKGVFLNFNTNYYDLSNDFSKVIFPNIDFIFSRKYLDQSGTGGGPKGFLPWATEEDFGISYSEMNTEFGVLEADFTGKQPVFKESAHKLPYPKQNQYSTLGNVYNTSWQVTVSDIWNGNYSYTALNVFKPLFIINKNGVYLTLYSEMGQATLDSFFADGDDFAGFTQKYMNRCWILDGEEWEEVLLGSNNDISNQKAVWGIVMPDKKVVHSLKFLDGVLSLKTGKEESKVENWNQFSTVPTNGTAYSVNNWAHVLSMNSLSKLFLLPEDGYYRMTGNFKDSKYKTEITQVPSNNSVSILRSKDAFYGNPIWVSSVNLSQNIPLSDGIMFKYGSRKIVDNPRFFPNFSESQRKLEGITIDFKEFASFGGCNVGVDSNGALWQWGIKLTTNIAQNLTAQTNFINDPVAIEAGTNWEPVRIDIPFKVKKLDFTGATGLYGSMNKALALLSDDGKIYTMGYINSSHQLSPTWRDATEVTSSISKFTEVKFRYNGLIAISENLDLCYSGLNPDGVSSTTITNIQKVDNPLWNGKVKNIRSMPNKASHSNGVKAVFTTTDGSAYGMGTKFTNQSGQKIPYDGKVLNIYYNNANSNDMVMMIDDKGKVTYVNRTGSLTKKFDIETWTTLNAPEGFRAEEWIYPTAQQPTLSMIFGKYGSGLTESGAVISMDSFVNASSDWINDQVGAMRADGFVWGSEVDTGSLFPVLDFLNDGEGSTGQDWSAGSWLTQSGDGEAPTPTEDEVLTGEGEVADRTTVDGVSFPTEWLEEPPIDPPVTP